MLNVNFLKHGLQYSQVQNCFNYFVVHHKGVPDIPIIKFEEIGEMKFERQKGDSECFKNCSSSLRVTKT